MKYFCSLILLFFCINAISQSLSINTDGTTANSSALLDVKSTTKGLLLPRMTKTQKNAIATPATGLLVYQTTPDSIGFHYYNGTVWLWLNPVESNDWRTTGNANTDTAVNFIGNIDNMPLRFKQNNISMGQFDINNANYFIGKGTGVKTTASVFNSVGFGDSALANNTTGDNNTGVGFGTLSTNNSGSDNTAVGFQADVAALNLINATAIGALAQAGASNSMVLGSIKNINGAIANVNVGIGTISPSTTLHVRKAPSGSLLTIPANRTLLIEDSVSSFIQLLNPNDDQTGIFSGNGTTLTRSGILFNADSTISFRTGGSSTNKVFVAKNGDVGLGNTVPEGKLHVSFSGKLINAQYINTPISVFEYGNPFGNAAIQLMCKSTSDFSIFSATDSVFARSIIEFSNDSSIRFFTGGPASTTANLMIAKNKFIGINISAPLAGLHIKGVASSFDAHIRLESSADTDYGNILYDGNMKFRTFGAGDEYQWRNSLNATNMRLQDDGDLIILGVLTQSSDARLKKNINPIQNSLTKITRLNGYQYNWIEPARSGLLQTGVLAQEVEQQMPELVKTDKDGMKSVNYNGITPYLIEAVKELKLEMELLKDEIKKLKSK